MYLKRLTALMCTCTLAVTMLSGCGGKEADSEAVGAGTPDTQQQTADAQDVDTDTNIAGTITVWEHNYSFESSLQKLIEGFEAQYPDVTVEYEIKDGANYYSLLSTAIQSGDGPDLFWTNGTATSNLSDYVKNNVCYDLTDNVDFSMITDDAMKLATIDNKVYSVPWLTMDTRTAYYNVDMFNENGWDIPSNFTEFETLLGTIKEAGYTPISLCPNDAFTLLFAFEPILAGYDPVYSTGLADYSVSATDDAIKECLNKMLEWADKGYFGDNWLGVTDNNSQILTFTSGEAAMNLAGSWDAATISDNNPELNYSAFAVPAEDGTTGLVGTAANGFSVNASSENLEASVAFANYCASKQAQTLWVQSLGAVSASTDIESSTDIAKAITLSGKGNVYTSWQSVLSNHSKDGEAATIWSEDFPKVFSKDVSVDEFLQRISAVMD